MKTLHKIILGIFLVNMALVSLFVVKVPTVGAVLDNDYILLAPLPGLTKGTCNYSDARSVCGTDFATYLVGGFKLAIGLAGAVAVLLIMWEGATYIWSASEKTKTKSRGRIQEILYGLLIAIGSVVILNFIDPSFTQFKFNFDKLKIQNNTPAEPQITDTGANQARLDATNRAITTNLDNIAGQDAALARNKENLTGFETAVTSFTGSAADRRILEVQRDNLRARVAVSEELIRRSQEVTTLAARGNVTAAEAASREMSLFYDRTARSWQNAGNAQGALEIRQEGVIRERDAYLHVNRARLQTELRDQQAREELPPSSAEGGAGFGSY